MKIGTGEARSADVRRFGKYYDALLNEQDWVRRRVETVNIIDGRNIDRAITLDIDGVALRRHANSAGLRCLDKIPVPLETLSKTLQLDLDVRGSSQEPLPVTTSDEDSKLAHSFVLRTIAKNGISFRALPPSVRTELYRLVRSPSIERLVEIGNQALDPTYAPDDAVGLRLSTRDLECWRGLLRSPEIRTVLVQTAQTYVFATQLSPPAEAFVVKFRYREDFASVSKYNLWTQLGLKAAELHLPAPGVGSAQREHMRIVVPDGTQITRARLSEINRGLPLTDFRSEMAHDEYGLRQGPSRAVIYTRDRDKGEYGARVRIRPTLSSFFLQALGVVAFTSVLLGFGAILETTSKRFSENLESADAAVAILALLPSIMAVYFIRQGEHRLLAHLHLLPRLLVLLSAISTVFVAASVSAGVEHCLLEAFFWSAFIVNVGVSIYLLAVVATIAIAAAVAIRRAPTFPRFTPTSQTQPAGPSR